MTRKWAQWELSTRAPTNAAFPCGLGFPQHSSETSRSDWRALIPKAPGGICKPIYKPQKSYDTTSAILYANSSKPTQIQGQRI